MRHLVIVAALNPSADVLGPRGTLAWSTAVERLYQVRVLEVVRNISHPPFCLGRNPGASDRPISVCYGRSNALVLGAGEFPDYGSSKNSN